MGWNSWNALHDHLNEQNVLASAQALIDTGLAQKGYRYVNIDDGWYLKRRQTDGRMIVENGTFSFGGDWRA